MTSNVPKAASAQPGISAGSIMQVFALALVIAALSEWLGPLPIELGIGKVVLLPMIWALLIGLILGLLAKRMPKPVSLGHSQHLAAAVLTCALFLFIAKLGLMVGGSLPQLAKVGWGLALQELGNLIGCVLLGMPVALLLGIKREAIGATFSIGREPGLAIVGAGGLCGQPGHFPPHRAGHGRGRGLGQHDGGGGGSHLCAIPRACE